MSGIISAPAFLHDFPQVEDETYEGFVVSIYAVGCFLGALFILNFGDRLGRRKSIFLGAIIMIIGVIIQIASVPPSGGATAQFIIGRCITGIGNGSKLLEDIPTTMSHGLTISQQSTPRLSPPTRPSAVSPTTVESSSASRAATLPSER